MTPDIAMDILKQGCPHNAWSDDVCGKCAKAVLAVWKDEPIDEEAAEMVKWLRSRDDD